MTDESQPLPEKAVTISDSSPSSSDLKSTEIDTQEDHFLKYANWYTSLVFLVATGFWLIFMPWGCSSKYELPTETDLCSRIQQAEIAAGQSGLLPVGCPKLPLAKQAAAGGAVGAATSPVSWMRLTRVSATTGSATTGAESLDDLKTDLVVWTRYEYEFKTFEWGKDVNWYLYSTLRVLVIILSALTPALIVAPILKDKKFIAALPAAIVAIAAGCISEFDFKDQAATYTQAAVTVQGEKTAFLTRSQPSYDFVSAGSGPPAASAATTPAPAAPATAGAPKPTSAPTAAATTVASTDSGNEACSDQNVPYPSPANYGEIRANFSCRIQYVWQTQSLARVLFLRGQTQSTGGVRSGSSRPSGGSGKATK
jgi:hypothetical protein